MLIDTKWHSKLCYYLYYLLDKSNSLENCHFFSWGREYTCIRNSAGWLVYKPIKSMNLLAIQEYLYFFFCCLGPVIGKKREKCSKIVINKVDLQFFFITNAVRMYLIFLQVILWSSVGCTCTENCFFLLLIESDILTMDAPDPRLAILLVFAFPVVFMEFTDKNLR